MMLLRVRRLRNSPQCAGARLTIETRPVRQAHASCRTDDRVRRSGRMAVGLLPVGKQHAAALDDAFEPGQNYGPSLADPLQYGAARIEVIMGEDQFHAPPERFELERDSRRPFAAKLINE